MITPASLSNGFIDFPYEQQMTVSGGTGPYQFALTGGTLPAGVSLSSSGLVSGTPTAPGTYNFMVSANDLNNFCFLGGAYTITIETCSILTLDLPPLSVGMVNEPYSETLIATGGVAPYTFAASSGLPLGLSLSASGLLSGTPTEDGIFNLRVAITDARGCTSKDSISIVILTTGVEPPGKSRTRRGSK